MSYCNSARKKQIKRCNKDKEYKFSIDGFDGEYRYLKLGDKYSLTKVEELCMTKKDIMTSC